MDRLDVLTQEQKEVLFAWEPNVDKLTERSVDEIEALVTRLPADFAAHRGKRLATRVHFIYLEAELGTGFGTGLSAPNWI